MMNLRRALREDVLNGVEAAIEAGELVLSAEMPSVVVDRSEKKVHGDYASPIALSLTKLTGKPPMEIVAIVVKYMPKKEYIAKIEAAAPGFLNIQLDGKWLGVRLDDVLERDLFLDVQMGQGKAINLEFVSANPTGPLTLGNARTAFSADTFGKVLEATGHAVTREYYINDAGGQVRRLGESVLRRILQEAGYEVDFPEGLYQGEYVRELGEVLAEQWRENEGKTFQVADLEDQGLVKKLSDEAVGLCLEMIEKMTLGDLKITFDVWTSERELRESGVIEEAIEKLKSSGHTYEKDGALWLRSTTFGDDQDRVLIKKDGEYAYLAPDVGYHEQKFGRKFDELFTYLGADHQGYIPRLRAAMEALGHDTEKLHFLVTQWLGLVKDKKPFSTSKRKGLVYGPQDLMAEVGYDAARFLMVQQSLSTHMELDLDLAKERNERNPVYYVQYAYVRLQSILRKAKQVGLLDDVEVDVPLVEEVELTEQAEIALAKELFALPEVVEGIVTSAEVHRLAFYAHDLARSVHGFYNEVYVLDDEDKGRVQGRLQLILAARKVLRETLDLLGISKPDVM